MGHQQVNIFGYNAAITTTQRAVWENIGTDYVFPTVAQALANSLAPRKIQLGIGQTRGLGAGSKPDVGRSAAEEQINDILACLEQTDMVFVTAGMGGGTGTGAAPVIARVAREAGILTVGVVTKPFDFEGNRRRQLAEHGIAELQQYVDTLIIIPNQNLIRLANERTTFADAFRMADEVLHCGVRGITDLMVMPGFMNLDFADVKTVMGEMGKAMMGTGEANGENRALRAAEAAISNPLLEDTSMKGAKGVLINITGGLDMTLFEVDQAANRIREEVDPDAQIKVGSTLSENLDGVIRVSVIATGIEAQGSIAAAQAAQSSAAAAAPSVGTFRTVNAPKPQAAPHGGFFTNPTANFRHAEPAHEPAPLATPSHAHLAHGQNFTAAPDMAYPTQQPQFTAPPARQVAPEPPAPPAAVAPSPQVQPNLRGQQVGGNFVAPRPLEINRMAQTPQQPPLPRSTSSTLSAQNVVEAQDLATQQKAGKRAESLFTRITGFGLIRPSIDQDAPAAPAAAQTRLNVDPSDRIQSSQNEEEDLLEIPAFLRRQTNH